MAMDPEVRPGRGADAATLGTAGAAAFGGHQQPQQLRPDWAGGRPPRSLRLQAVCGAVSCVDESPTAAATHGVSLLRNDKASGENAGSEATSPKRKAARPRGGNLSRSLSRQPSRSGTDQEFACRFDTTSGESPTPSPGRVPTGRGPGFRPRSSAAAAAAADASGSAVPCMTAAQAAGSARAAGYALAGFREQPAVAPPAVGAVFANGAVHPAAAAGAAMAVLSAPAAPTTAQPTSGGPASAAAAFNPNDLAAMNARLAAGLASLPPPPPLGDQTRRSGSDASGTCRQGCSNGGGSCAESDHAGSGSRKRRERSPDSRCRLRYGGRDSGGGGSGMADGSHDGHDSGSSDSDSDSAPRPAVRPIKVQRIAIGMSTTDEPAAAGPHARAEDEGTSARHHPLDPGPGGAQEAEPVLRLPPGTAGWPLPDLEVFQGYWGLDDVRRRRGALFVFGDNDARRGRGGQAAIRGEPNAIGLATKRTPSHIAAAYYRDEDFDANAAKISGGVAHILDALLQGRRPDADAHPSQSTLGRGADATAAARASALPAATTSKAVGGGCAAQAGAAGGEHGGTGGGGDPCGQHLTGSGRLPYAALVVPADGFGTGRARLRTDAPRTFAFLKRQVTQLLELLRPGSSAELHW